MDKKKQLYYSIATLAMSVSIAVELAFMANAFKTWLYAIFWVALALALGVFAFGIFKKIDSLIKLARVGIFCALVILSGYMAMYKSGFIERFDSAEEIAEYISDNPYGIILFILISFLQVTFIPIPSTITTVTGTLVFGTWEGMLYSLIGQISGSMFAFFLGRKFGSKLAKWIAGEEMFEKYNKYIKGRDKVIFAYMLLFPFFPDDLICLFFGLTNMSYLGFFLLVSLSRVITISYTSYLTDLISRIPLTPIGFLIYALIALVVVGLLVLCWKKGEWLEDLMTKIIYKIMPKKLAEKRKRELEQAESERDDSDASEKNTSET